MFLFVFIGQGGCQAIEDAYVIAEELASVQSRTEISDKLKSYHKRRLVRSAVVQGLSRFASDIIIQGFDTPAKIVWTEEESWPRFENFNYAGIVTRLLQPFLPLFFSLQFNYLYEGFRNEMPMELGAPFAVLFVGGVAALAMGTGII